MVRPAIDTPEGKKASKKFRETMLKKYGGEEGIREFHSKIGRLGGMNGRGPNYKGGFASDRERAMEAGRKGGLVSRRDKEFEEVWNKIEKDVIKMYNSGNSIADISRTFKIPYYKIKYRLDKMEAGKDIEDIEKILERIKKGAK